MVAARPAAGPRLFTMAQNGAKVTLAAGSSFAVQLTGQPSTGYDWYLASDSTKLVVLDGRDVAPPTQPGLGRQEQETLRLHAAAAGNGVLRIEYKRAWEQNTAPAQVFTLNLTIR